MRKTFNIGRSRVGGLNPVFIIAEAGVNHNGDEGTARKMITAAAQSGADAIKFQTYITEELVSCNAPFAQHHLMNVRNARSHFELLKKLELPLAVFARLKSFAEAKGLEFISTPYDIISARYLASIKLPAIKIASSEVEDFPLLESVIRSRIPVIVSCGMNNMDTVRKAVALIMKNRISLAILKCTSNYPVDYANINLLGLSTLKKTFKGCVIGFSDHSRGIEAACAAVALGAKIIEKHFTLNKGMWGPDHRASLNPSEFSDMVQAIRNTEKALGSKEIKILNSEKMQKYSMQKGIYARTDIAQGKPISMADLVFLRPAKGVSSSEYKICIGRKSRCNINKGTPISLKLIS